MLAFIKSYRCRCFHNSRCGCFCNRCSFNLWRRGKSRRNSRCNGGRCRYCLKLRATKERINLFNNRRATTLFVDCQHILYFSRIFRLGNVQTLDGMACSTHHSRGANTQYTKRFACDNRWNGQRRRLLQYRRFGNWWLLYNYFWWNNLSFGSWRTHAGKQTKLPCILGGITFSLTLTCFASVLQVQGSLRFFYCLHSFKLIRCRWCRYFLGDGLTQQISLRYGSLLNRSRTDFHLLWFRNGERSGRILGLQVRRQLLDYLGVLSLHTSKFIRYATILLNNTGHQTIYSKQAFTYIFGLLLPQQCLLFLEQLCV